MRDIEADGRHWRLIRDIAEQARRFSDETGVDALEVVACIGCAAGAFISSCDDAERRHGARQSVITSMDGAIEHFSKLRQIN